MPIARSRVSRLSGSRDVRTPIVVTPSSGTSVQGVGASGISRVKPDDVKFAYVQLGCRIGFTERVEIEGRTGDLIACDPLMALVVARGVNPGAAGRWNRHEVGLCLGLESDYVLGFQSGWLGERPEFSEVSARLGWQDGSAVHAALSAWL